MVECDISMSMVNDLKRYILQEYNSYFLQLSDLENVSRNNYLATYMPYLIENKHNCIARVWNNGFGKQCSHKKKHNDLCSLHLKQYRSEKGLVLGTIFDDRPDYFNKYSI